MILVLAAFVVYLSLRTPKRPELGNTDAVKHTIDSLVSVNTRLEQDALKQSLLIREGVRKADSIETLFLRQKVDIEKIKADPDEMLNKDPQAQAMLEECLVRMPNQNLSDAHKKAILFTSIAFTFSPLILFVAAGYGTIHY